MSKPDLSIEPKLLKSAKDEFINKGFENASLKEICNDADVTTGALYKRYKGKEELFCAVVKQTVDDLQGYLEGKSELRPSELSDEQLIDAWNMDNGNMLEWFKFLYERYDTYVLLISKAQGTRYSNFKHDWCQLMNNNTYEYYLEAKRRHLTDVDVSEKEMHALMSTFWTAIYEPFIHDFTWEEILIHNDFMSKMFNWNEIFKFHNPSNRNK